MNLNLALCFSVMQHNCISCNFLYTLQMHKLELLCFVSSVFSEQA